MPQPNWAEQVTAIFTAIGSIGLLSTLGLAIFAGLQVRESQQARHAQIAAEFLRRWDEADLVETRRLVARFESAEQLGALEHVGALHLQLVQLLLGKRLVDRWTLWKPSIDAMGGDDVYPMFASLAAKVERSPQPA